MPKNKKNGGTPEFNLSNSMPQQVLANTNATKQSLETDPVASSVASSVAAPVVAPVAAPVLSVASPAAATKNSSVVAAGNGGKLPGGMNEAFVSMYKLLAILSALMFVILFLLAWADVFCYTYDQISQKNQLSKGPVFIKDTTDYNDMKYITTNSMSDEPYYIFTEESVISYIYTFFGIFVLLMGIQYGIYFGLMLYSKFKGQTFSDEVKPPMMDVGTIVLAVSGATILTVIYKDYFIKKTQGTLKNIRTHMREIKSFIYSHITTNSDFLKALTNNDIKALLSIFNSEITKNNRNDCTSPVSNCDGEVQRMVFTISLFSFYKDQVPEADPNYQTVISIFSPENIQSEKIDPTLYFYYKQAIYIPNIYSTLQDLNGDKFFTDPERESIFMSGLNTLLQTANKKLAILQTISNGKKSILNYILVFATTVTLFMGIFIAIYYDNEHVKLAIELIREFIKSIIQWILSKFKGSGAKAKK